jgi:serine/threonine protein phosphatase 1
MITYAVGDVHGCIDQLVGLVTQCLRHAGDQPTRFVFIGDYIDRGPNSRAVIDFLLAIQRQKGPDVIALRGNHEAMMLNTVRTGDGALWLINGAVQTLASYGIDDWSELPPEHLDWIASLPLCFDDGQRYFVHAGINPAVPLDQQTEHDQLWIREPFLSDPRDFGRLIVHGHTPLTTGRPDQRPNRVNIDTAAVFGGPLTAAVFTDDQTDPIGFLASSG